MAAKLNTRLNYQPKDDDEKMDDDSEQTFRKYEEELEINDFPQQARWRVTSKVILKYFEFYILTTFQENLGSKNGNSY